MPRPRGERRAGSGPLVPAAEICIGTVADPGGTPGGSGKKSVKNFYTALAIEMLDAELQLLEKRLQYPEHFATRSDASARSPLHWRATPTELAELLCALDFSGAVCDADGGKATFTDLVSQIEGTFNIRLGNPHDLKRNVLRRKTRLTVFLDKLRRLLNEYSFVY